MTEPELVWLHLSNTELALIRTESCGRHGEVILDAFGSWGASMQVPTGGWLLDLVTRSRQQACLPPMLKGRCA